MSLELDPSVAPEGLTLVVADGVSGSPLFFGVDRVLVDCWVQLYAVPVANQQIMFVGEQVPSFNSRFELQITPAQLVNVIVRTPDGAGPISVLSVGTIPVETAAAQAFPSHHIGIFFDAPAGTITITIDGVVDSVHAVAIVAFSATVSGSSSIGYQEIGVVQGLDGKISNARVINLGAPLGPYGDLAQTIYRLNGHDTYLGSTPGAWGLGHQFDQQRSGVVAVLSDVSDQSSAPLAPPVAVMGAPIFAPSQHAPRRFT